MKKLCIVLSMIFISTLGFSQSLLQYGATGGLNFSFISEKVDPKPSGYESENANGIGFLLGGYAVFQLTDQINFRPELHFDIRRSTSKGTEVIEEFDGTTTTYDYKSVSRDVFLTFPLFGSYALNDQVS